MKLKFGERLIEPEIRRLYDLRDVAFDTAWFEGAVDCDAYFMFRDLALTPADAETIMRHQLRYDITIIPPFNVGLEFVKTYGATTCASARSSATRIPRCTRCLKATPFICCSTHNTKTRRRGYPSQGNTGRQSDRADLTTVSKPWQ